MEGIDSVWFRDGRKYPFFTNGIPLNRSIKGGLDYLPDKKNLVWAKFHRVLLPHKPAMKRKVFHPNWATFKRVRPNLNYPEAKQENYLAKHHYCARGRRFLSSFFPSKLTSGEALYFVGRKWSINFHPLKNGNAKVFPSGLLGGRRGVCFSNHFPPTPPWKIKQKKKYAKGKRKLFTTPAIILEENAGSNFCFDDFLFRWVDDA